LPAVPADEAASPPRRRRRRAGVDVVVPGAVVGPSIPVAVDDNITVLTVNELVGPSISVIAARPSNYIVVRRPERHEADHVYAYAPGS
jgi:hypothetical protein